MRPFFVSLTLCLGAACTAALAVPLAPGATAHPALAHPGSLGKHAGTAAGHRTPGAGDLPGTTQSLPLDALGPAAPGTAVRSTAAPPATGTRALPARTVRPFSLVGIVWDDIRSALPGRAQVRTRTLGTGRWTGWQDLPTDSDDAPDPGAGEHAGGRERGSTAPLWVGVSNAVQLRITPPQGNRHPAALPSGLRLELVDPGPEPHSVRGGPPPTPAADASSAANAKLAPLGATEIPAQDQAASQADIEAAGGKKPTAPAHLGARPRIVTRAGWGADERLRETRFVYTHTVRAAFVHHSASGNNYTCAQAPSVIRGLYRYHVKSSHWRDIGYNFLIDKCGTVYEGRAGGVARPVMGAHTLGFNTDSTGIALLGSFGRTEPSKAAVEALARLTAWKLGLYGLDPRARVPMTSTGGNLYHRGRVVRQHVISGHRDGFKTACPGARLYAELPEVRLEAARLQGR
ncbi:peptidoglycan recognition protein family protein [Streptomyces sp. YGL11-2]|uniref:peptidoglycan recognition protein family protein n=1 Tax=Streptomyces sp. YGL11-2 TaxID=3414028 RepID=UPI003CFAA454